MNNVAILTYHSAYNFGSVLQAYATQTALARLGYSAEIINYRLDEQKYFYQRLLRLKYGPKTAIKDLLLLPIAGKRLERARRFEKFILERLVTTREVSTPEQVAELWGKYDVIISGSDQIWSKNSHELRANSWENMDPYLLKGFPGRKISYASSIGSMTDEQLQRILPCVNEFDAISFREVSAAKRMGRMLDRKPETVLDPTLLLDRQDWIDAFDLRENGDKYILLYSLRNPQTLRKLLRLTAKLAEQRGCKVRVVAPFAWLPIVNRRIEFHPEYGPVDFLNALYGAEAVVTDSYHGTVLSVNFGKEFYTIGGNGGTKYRMKDALELLGLGMRMRDTLDEISIDSCSAIHYEMVDERLKRLKEKSIDYLRRAMD